VAYGGRTRNLRIHSPIQNVREGPSGSALSPDPRGEQGPNVPTGPQSSGAIRARSAVNPATAKEVRDAELTIYTDMEAEIVAAIERARQRLTELLGPDAPRRGGQTLSEAMASEDREPFR
jgi:hypothetical protein